VAGYRPSICPHRQSYAQSAKRHARLLPPSALRLLTLLISSAASKQQPELGSRPADPPRFPALSGLPTHPDDRDDFMVRRRALLPCAHFNYVYEQHAVARSYRSRRFVLPRAHF